MLERNEFLKSFTNAINDMTEREDGVYYWLVDNDKDKKNTWAFVLGWNYYGEESSDKYSKGEYRLCVKLVYQPCNAYMQCDYDYDWLMPCDEETGDVYETEYVLYNDEDIVRATDYLYECYNTICSNERN